MSLLQTLLFYAPVQSCAQSSKNMVHVIGRWHRRLLTSVRRIHVSTELQTSGSEGQRPRLAIALCLLDWSCRRPVTVITDNCVSAGGEFEIRKKPTSQV